MEKQIELEPNKPKIELWLPHGNLAEEIFKEYKNKVKKYAITDWDRVEYNPETKQILGMNNICAGIMNFVGKKFGLSVTTNEDNEFGDIYNFIKGKYYAEFNTLCVAPKKPSYEKNNGLWKRAMEIGEEKFGEVKNKFRINGFYYMPDENEKGYGVRIVPAEDFEIIENSNIGREDGVSGVYLGGGGGLYSGSGDLEYSGVIGRGVWKKSRSDALKN